jgi:5-formyltetrahydrofolate cyclo-ligase
MPDKVSLRQRIRHQRAALSARSRHRFARTITERLRGLQRFRRAHRIAAYLAHKGEVDAQPCIELALGLGKRVYLPVLHPFFHGRLRFCELRGNTVLTPNRYGIPEPSANTRCLPQQNRLDLVLVPLVAFDRLGYRLGMGGGYYDRSFATGHANHRIRPLLIGLAYEFQYVDTLPHEAWDIRLDAVATEQRLHRFSRSIR